ncbi:MAG TPA: response regulator [Thermoanaerobaculia bacterium]|nr:response regulator [Thermoanaerobaculia bacterium]
MSLLGRLEDLSLTDIIQIVFLSRRTGVLEIIDGKGRHTVLFRSGLVVNASSPGHPDLVSYLLGRELIAEPGARMLRKMEESGIPYGTATVELNLMSPTDLGSAIRARILDVVTPLLQSREGEFNFILSDAMSALDVEYDPELIFREGGLSPQRIVGGGEGEKIKPLKGLEESLKAGKALLRGSAPAETTPASLNLGLGQPLNPGKADNVVQFPKPEAEQPTAFSPVPDEPLPEIADEAPPRGPDFKRPESGKFKVAGGLIEVESPEATYRNVVLFERNPLVRVAARRAFTKHGVKIFQYGSLDDVRGALTDLFRSNSFFVSFLELTDADRNADGPTVRILQQLKRRNPRLPVVVVDQEADLRRRHALLRAGADLYLTKPSPARLQPGLAEEELALFADELVLFADRAFANWEQVTGGFGADAGRRFYELADKENLDRSFGVLKQLINELSNPNDIAQVSQTILRLSAEYLERGALFMANDEHFVGLGGFGITGGVGEAMDARVKRMKITRGAPSILTDVATAGEPHRGKMRRTPANVELIERLGGLLPTEVIALPIMHSQRTIGILYGDNAEHRAPIDSMTGLEIFLSQAGYAFSNAVFASAAKRL